MLHEPHLCLLDEPTAGVDPKARREFWDEIHGLAAAGITVLVSTHYMDEAERCHEIAYIAFGGCSRKGTAEEVVAHSGLVTWDVSGPDLRRLAAALQGCAASTCRAVRHRLHVAGRTSARSRRRSRRPRTRTAPSLDARRARSRTCSSFSWVSQGQFRMTAAAYLYSASERRDPGFLRRMWR